LTVPELKQRYAEVFGEPTRTNHKQYLIKRIVWRMQALREGDLSERARRRAIELADDAEIRLSAPKAHAHPGPGTVITAAFDAGRPPSFPKPGSVLRREYKGKAIVVRVLPRGFEYEGEVYRSLTAIAQKVTGAHWNGVSFFGLPSARGQEGKEVTHEQATRAKANHARAVRHLHPQEHAGGLEQEFNSLDAQRESGEAYIASQKAEGWQCLPDRYDDGGFTGGNMDRPALKRLMADIEAGKVDCVVVYKVDRLSRSLIDFARLMELFERKKISFVSVTQQFNTTQSMGRLTLNILLSFAQFEREIISERTRDKIAAARRKGKWSGGRSHPGYDVDPTTKKLVVNEAEAELVREIFRMYLQAPVAAGCLPRTEPSRHERPRRCRPGRVSGLRRARVGQTRGAQDPHQRPLPRAVRYKTRRSRASTTRSSTEAMWNEGPRTAANQRALGRHARPQQARRAAQGLDPLRPVRVTMGHTSQQGRQPRLSVLHLLQGAEAGLGCRALAGPCPRSRSRGSCRADQADRQGPGAAVAHAGRSAASS
jgi:DNA invertase Pin-like site-specific DNA recombinase